MSATSFVWFIVGVSQSTGLGHEIALSALARGDKVILAVRFNKGEHLLQLQDSHPDACSIVQMDVTDNFDILLAGAQQAIAIWGKVDVVVNNAGDFYWGHIEELKADGFKEVFNTNVFGMVNVANAFLPHMRRRRSGTVIFLGSRSAWRSMPTTSTYASSKAAIHGARDKLRTYSFYSNIGLFALVIADILAEELRSLNIRVLNIVPGALRTGALNRVRYPSDHKLPCETGSGNFACKAVQEYAQTSAKVAEIVEKSNGYEPGDPKKAATIIVDVVRGEGVAEGRTWPGTLYLGSDGEAQIRNKCAEILKTLDEWSDVTRSIEFDR